MLPLRFDEIGSEDILKLVAAKNPEQKTLEYKAKLNIDTGDEKAEFLADISSFANASGGDIVFGISDERDGENKATGIPGEISGLSIENPEAELGRVSQIIESGVQPRFAFQAKVISIPDKGSVILIRVPKSWDSPHMVTYSNRTRFYSRNGIVGKVQLDVRQIGAAFAEQRGVGERLRAWKADRIAKAVAGEGPVELKGVSVLWHFVSVPTLNDDQVLPRAFNTSMLHGQPLMSLSTEFVRYNADGYLMSSHNVHGTARSYLQVFREGHLEYGDCYALDSDHDGHIAGGIMEDKLINTFGRAALLLKALGTADPIFVCLTLIGMKGIDIYLPSHAQSWNGATSLPFDRDIIICPDIQLQNLDEGEPYRSTLRPIVDAIWQAAGRETSPYAKMRWDAQQ
ncbi:helix-turn-helix domain-containing protein [Granulicella mallensis]|jgi:hypothetical protein|uniref:Schlafen AlbA-2 domain-containing protein n=1 Tax=Granulicella mallensis TaxID=940614 RepID=A0A7W7ZSQ4_9BACT|nr:ATP-binding protein [Granulicella mallensis]MBB5065067.1 hypothetical protein [Granulicella mallensis]